MLLVELNSNRFPFSFTLFHSLFYAQLHARILTRPYMTQTPKLVVTPSPSCPDLSSLELNESSLSTNNNSQPSGCDTTSDPNSVPNRSDRPPNGRRSGADKVRWLLARTRLLKLPRGWKMGDLQSPKRSRSTASNDAGAKYDSASEQPIHVLPRFLNQSDDGQYHCLLLKYASISPTSFCYQ